MDERLGDFGLGMLLGDRVEIIAEALKSFLDETKGLEALVKRATSFVLGSHPPLTSRCRRCLWRYPRRARRRIAGSVMPWRLARWVRRSWSSSESWSTISGSRNWSARYCSTAWRM